MLDGEARRARRVRRTALDVPVLLQEANEARLERFVTPHAREVMLLSDQLEVEREHQQSKRRRGSERCVEIARARHFPRRDGKGGRELLLERSKELVVIEDVETQQRNEHVTRVRVVGSARTRSVGQTCLEHVEHVQVAHGADLIQPHAVALVERAHGRHPGESLRQETTRQVEGSFRHGSGLPSQGCTSRAMDRERR
jgi:hypothetical protein